ncbi:MAG TPA: sensor domain-containing diguanylate cyclase [Candidatus Omnitrophota bacterium]|nr:sensor domain-containing diguanylate cyclase [Candidatus Omnitrophota bacterium]
MKRVLQELSDSIFKNIVHQLYDGVYFVNNERQILFWNKQAEKITGYSARAVLNKFCHDNFLMHTDEKGRQLCLQECPLTQSIKNNHRYAKRVYLRRKDGVRLPVDIRTGPIKHAGRIVGAVEIFRDASIYERIQRQRDRAKVLAQIDPLTSLSNRRDILKRLGQEMKKAKKFGEELSVAVMDVDYFKEINDRYGHQTGDAVLRNLAALLRQNLRPTDCIGRYGGEEFVLLLKNTPSQNARIVLERIRRAVGEKRWPVMKGHRLTVSIGLTKVYPEDFPDDVFKRADQALYRAKRSGRNSLRVL